MIYVEEIDESVSRKQQSETGRKLLLRGLQTEFGLSELPEIELGEYGKPFFKSHPEIHFNISHCDRAVVCVLSEKSVGIDVETIHPFDEDLAEYISSSDELKCILSHRNPALAFTILWTKKESYCKLTGKGLDTRKDIQEILQNNPSQFHTCINEAGGYVITSCI